MQSYKDFMKFSEILGDQIIRIRELLDCAEDCAERASEYELNETVSEITRYVGRLDAMLWFMDERTDFNNHLSGDYIFEVIWREVRDRDVCIEDRVHHIRVKDLDHLKSKANRAIQIITHAVMVAKNG